MRPEGPKHEARMAESCVGFFSPPARVSGGDVSSPSGVRSKAPAAVDFGAF